MKTRYLQLLIIGFIFWSCNNGNSEADAYGNFQATEVIVSSETSGKIVLFDFTEGDILEKGSVVVKIDSVQYALKLKELKARKQAVIARKANVVAQVNVYMQQLQVLEKDQLRLKNMLKDGAATQKQFDDVEGQVSIIKKQISAVESNLAGINAEVVAIDASIAQAIDMKLRTKVKSPVKGTIIQKYVQEGEIAAPGRALFKVADLTNMELKAYISGNQLSSVNIGDDVSVYIDGDKENLKKYTGKISWIASEAEFTPKNIQTREERLSQVYAIKVLVKNDGAIKINMPGEVVLTKM